MTATLAGLMLLLSARWASASDLGVVVRGIAPSEGQVIVRLFDETSAFPDGERVLYAQVVPVAQEGTARAVFVDLPPKTYAVAAIHDQDCNGTLTRAAPYGFPVEGLGFSEGQRVDGRVPTFAEAGVRVDQRPREIAIALHYLPVVAQNDCAAGVVPSGTATLTVSVGSVTAGRGDVIVQLVAQGERFPPRREGGAGRVALRVAEDPTVRLRFVGLPPGRYAAVSFQDFNSNRQLDIGEPIAISGDVRAGRLPGFEQASVQVDQDASISIALGGQQ